VKERMPVIGDAAMLRQKYSFAEGLKGLIVDYNNEEHS
jgi:hypothetical protein